MRVQQDIPMPTSTASGATNIFGDSYKPIDIMALMRR